MASTDEPASLELWSLAAFRAASFTAAAVLLLHRRGSLAATLSRLDTAIGVATYLLLWTTTWFATRTGLRLGRDEDGLVGRRVMPAIVAGGWNGVYVFIAPLIGVLGLIISQGSVLSVLPIAAIGSTLGSLLAFVVGAVAGWLYGMLEALLDRVGSRLFEWVTAADGSSDRPRASRPM
jgi:hypothetical protein